VQSMEKRNSPRHNKEASILCSFFRTDRSDPAYTAKMVNYGGGGMGLQSSRLIKPGTSLLCKLQDCAFSNADSQSFESPRTISIAEVRWCREIRNVDEPCFGIGVKYI
jgi:hypothetical protein